jgi:hypothetical protein
MPGRSRREALAALVTLRDWLRWAMNRFHAAGISDGHGIAAMVQLVARMAVW